MVHVTDLDNFDDATRLAALWDWNCCNRLHHRGVECRFDLDLAHSFGLQSRLGSPESESEPIAVGY